MELTVVYFTFTWTQDRLSKWPQTARRLFKGPDFKRVWEICFRSYSKILLERFNNGGNGNWAPKKRPFLFGDKPLVRGMRMTSQGIPILMESQLKPSLTVEGHPLQTKTVMNRNRAQFGTRFKWAQALFSGYNIIRNRMTVAKFNKGLHWTDDYGVRQPPFGKRVYWTADKNPTILPARNVFFELNPSEYQFYAQNFYEGVVAWMKETFVNERFNAEYAPM